MILRPLAFLLLSGTLSVAADASAFREDWKEIPWALPVTQEHVANPALVLELHWAQNGIKKSNHDHINNDPFYIWSGKCELNWALSLSHRRSLIDLSSEDARVRWRSRQSGDRELHLIMRLPGGRWIVSEETDPATEDWHEFEFAPAKCHWRYLNIITVTPGEAVPAPDLSRVDAIGFTDLAAGNGSKQCSRLDWIEAHGKVIARPPRKPPAVKTNRARFDLTTNITEHIGLTFAHYGKREMKLDLYLPNESSEEPRPAVVFIHGGGWYKGSRSAFAPLARKLAAGGFVTANIEYRLSGEAPFPAAIHDCKAAVRWLRANAEKYKLDPDRIGAVGGSAGGHLCGLLATSAQLDKLAGDGGNTDLSNAIQAAVIMAGAMELTTPEMLERANSDPRRRLITFMGGTWEATKQNYLDASPDRHIDANTPPLCFMDGEFDKPDTRYTITKQKLDALKIPHETHVIKGAPHPFWSVDPFFDPTSTIVAAFFKQHLR